MAFLPYTTPETRAFEYYPAAAATYVTGQGLTLTSGKLTAIAAASQAAPAFICMFTGTIAASAPDGDELIGGNVIPVVRPSSRDVYECQLAAALTSPTIGMGLEISAGGLTVDGTKTGAAVLVSFSGAGAAGDMVRIRFIGTGVSAEQGGNGEDTGDETDAENETPEKESGDDESGGI
jgi:hypothetical protein